MRALRIAAAGALCLACVVFVLSCANRGEPFKPIRPGVIDSTKVDGVEFGRWTRKESPYYIIEDVLVPKGKTLTIDPGVTVIFIDKSLNLKVEGTLIAEGKPESLITFQPTVRTGFPTFPGDWGSIIFKAASGSVRWSRILYATNGIVATDSDLSVTSSVVKYTQFDAIQLTRSSLDLTDCTIASNGGYGLTLNGCENPPYPVRIIHCNIGLNRYAGIWSINSSLFAERSDIKNNGSEGEPNVEALSGGIHFQGAPGLLLPEFRECNIELNEPCDIRNLMSDNVAADSLYWGIRTTDEMNALSNVPDPSHPRPNNCTFPVTVLCEGDDGGSISFCWWREDPWPNF